MEEVDANPGLIFDQIDGWLDGLFRLLPNIAVALVVLVLFWFLAKWIGGLIRRMAMRRDRDSLGEVGGSLVRWGLVVVGFMLAVTIVAPTISPGDLIAGLGVSSVAIGFAFKDILQNMLAGVLILLRQPFEVGDQIVSGGHEGTVEKIETRATFITTYDGRRVVIPNADIYTDSVVVNTAFETRRSEYDIGIGCSDDWDKARRLMEETCAGVDGVESDPAPETIPIELGDSANVVRLRWWTKSDRASQIHVFGTVLQEVYKALDADGIDMPYPTQVHLFHDQTEETDGDRTKQREGWPASGDDPRPAREADRKARKSGGDAD
ncbi:mechanosensitive ion channel family protein [Gymnodinialimonas ceratoperidinii]|uniref:Small-conductance mechanosensitive channel n=1 Tax=Gymnodinialimonas ceratoperidinii TaxID=2856823 RepID=A0A8F6YAF7_9RHOB|nr:mechanosensitive ion channel family protein [Gymnodinialimonas ceratoperidinii]QXT39894.1 mechanosensitive ion channel family protein [Gymnodinialimonas ceratoperidinii]